MPLENQIFDTFLTYPNGYHGFCVFNVGSFNETLETLGELVVFFGVHSLVVFGPDGFIFSWIHFYVNKKSEHLKQIWNPRTIVPARICTSPRCAKTTINPAQTRIHIHTHTHTHTQLYIDTYIDIYININKKFKYKMVPTVVEVGVESGKDKIICVCPWIFNRKFYSWVIV